MSSQRDGEHPLVLIRPNKPVREMTDAEMTELADEFLAELRAQRDASRDARKAPPSS